MDTKRDNNGAIKLKDSILATISKNWSIFGAMGAMFVCLFAVRPSVLVTVKC